MTRRPALLAAGVVLLPGALVALVVAGVPSLAAPVRQRLPLPEAAAPGSPAEAAAIALTNLRLAAVLLAPAVLRRRLGSGAAIAVVPGVVLAAANSGAVGAAVGAWGSRLAPWLVHLPLEAGAFTAALGVGLRGRLARRDVLTVAALVLAGAVVEAYVTPLAVSA